MSKESVGRGTESEDERGVMPGVVLVDVPWEVTVELILVWSANAIVNVQWMAAGPMGSRVVGASVIFRDVVGTFVV